MCPIFYNSINILNLLSTSFWQKLIPIFLLFQSILKSFYNFQMSFVSFLKSKSGFLWYPWQVVGESNIDTRRAIAALPSERGESKKRVWLILGVIVTHGTATITLNVFMKLLNVIVINKFVWFTSQLDWPPTSAFTQMCWSRIPPIAVLQSSFVITVVLTHFRKLLDGSPLKIQGLCLTPNWMQKSRTIIGLSPTTQKNFFARICFAFLGIGRRRQLDSNDILCNWKGKLFWKCGDTFIRCVQIFSALC